MILYVILKTDKSSGNVIESVIDIFIEEEYATVICKRYNDTKEAKTKYRVKQFKAKGISY